MTCTYKHTIYTQVRGAERALMARLRALLDAGCPEGLTTAHPAPRHEPLPSTAWPAAMIASRPVSKKRAPYIVVVSVSMNMNETLALTIILLLHPSNKSNNLIACFDNLQAHFPPLQAFPLVTLGCRATGLLLV